MAIAEEPIENIFNPIAQGAAEATWHDIIENPNIGEHYWDNFINNTDPATRILFKTILNQIGSNDPSNKKYIAQGIGLAILYNDKITFGRELDKEVLGL